LPFLGYTQLFGIPSGQFKGQNVPLASVGAATPARPYFLHHGSLYGMPPVGLFDLFDICMQQKQNKNLMSESTQNVFCTMLATNLNFIAIKKRFRSECEKFLKKTSSRMLPAV
jgi:hypothetical protein